RDVARTRSSTPLARYAPGVKHDADATPPEPAPAGMDPDDEVCLCFHVSLRKLANFIRRTEPKVPSQISECLGAGTGCRWCVPFLEKLHRQWKDGEPISLPIAPAEYAKRRARYRSQSRREGRRAAETDDA
ncbi:MAG: (2Fe-2S)-binding protein, partial [Phycisphaerales bacterium]